MPKLSKPGGLATDGRVIIQNGRENAGQITSHRPTERPSPPKPIPTTNKK